MTIVRRVTGLASLLLLASILGLAGCSKKSAPELTTDPGSGTGTDVTELSGGNGDGGTIDQPDELDRPKTLSPVFFDYDAFNLRSDARRMIEDNAQTLLANPEWRVITLEGHCDERGTTEYNLALGQKRADSVRAYLVQLGVPRERLQTISYGEERPFDPGHGEAAWAQNRRVHFSR